MTKAVNRVRTHPGVTLKCEMEQRGISANALALALRVPANRITAIVNGERAITPETALRLARYFGNNARFWLTMQLNYDLSVEEAEKGARIETEVIPANS